MQALIDRDIQFSDLKRAENKEVAASLLTLKTVIDENIYFNIPIYQRLYVWKTDQIRTLLEDLKNAFLNNPNDYYFLGAIMLSSNSNEKIDLVDGQQRFTTMWLLCDILTESNPDLEKFTYYKSEPRIHFSIRTKAQEYLKDKNSFKEYINDNGDILPGIEAEISEIIPLVEGRNTIIGWLEDLEIDRESFGAYLLSKVQFSQTFIPSKSDMNRVFEAMNNRGKQLEHHELLKSKILNVISSEKRATYGRIWDSCSNMNKYIEKSLKDVTNLTWKDIFSNYKFLKNEESEVEVSNTKYDLDSLNIVELLNKDSREKEHVMSLSEILGQELDEDQSNVHAKINEEEYSSKNIRSIISFPTFLLHTLRVYQAKTKGLGFDSSDVNDKNLIENFSVDTFFTEEKDATYFIELLWELRVLFDRYVIKWIYDEETREEYHGIENIQISKNMITNKDETKNEVVSIQRIESTDKILKDLMVLQGMLYHSQEMITQYWLTPFLYYLSVAPELTNKDILDKLETLDNELFYSNYVDKLKDRSYEVIFKDNKELLQNLKDTKEYLSSAKGTGYPNYIFYKLEYILWKNKEMLLEKYSELNKDKWANYRLTAKNSVEHIYPQNTRDENKHIEYIEKDKLDELNKKNINPLDEFGNLVLLSPGMNSEYSNKPYQEKRGGFISKRTVDSLKSALIFKQTDWNYEKAVKHRNKMVCLIESHINSNKERL